MTEEQLTSVFYTILMKEFPKEDANVKLWELAKRMSKMAQPRKSYQKLYNSVESRNQRSKLKGGK